MSSEPMPSRWTAPRAATPILSVCVLLSVLVHLGSALGAGVYLAERAELGLESSGRAVLPDLLPPVSQPDESLRLGRSESSTASIAWLGVVKDEVVGQGNESQVEQAELTINEGVRDSQATPAAQPSELNEPIPQTPTEQAPIEEQQPETVEPAVELPVELPVEQTTEPEAEPDPIEEESPLQTDEPEPDIASSETEAPLPVIEQKPAEQPVIQPTQETADQATTPTQPVMPTPSGKPGQVDQRESVASIIKRAKEVRAESLNRPLSGEGLEIRTVEPRYPATVRFTQLPRNPIVLIRFDASGRVVKARFLHDEDKKKVYDTGSKGVDEPLINAIYKWRALGKQIDELDPDDPESTIEISMKILFRKE